MGRENHHLFPKTFYTTPLETWVDTIKRQSYEEEKFFLERIVHYKALTGTEHEFLVVCARHPCGFKIILGVDRNAQYLASKRTSGSAFQDTDTTQPSTVTSSSSGSLHLAYDSVQVSHNGTPAPILAQHGPCVPLHMITFPSTSTSSNSDARRPPSLLHLSILLLTIRNLFPSYDLFQYQCYFFARATCLALMDLFGGVETELEEGRRMATWRGVHISLYSAGSKVLRAMLLNSVGREALQKMRRLPPVMFPALILSSGLLVTLYLRSESDRRRISDEKIRQHAIPDSYRAAWRPFEL